MKRLRILLQYLRVRYWHRFGGRAALEAWQRRKLRRFLARLCEESPFYRHYAGRELEAFPIVDKAVVMREFDRLNTRGLRRDESFELALRAERTRDFSPTIRGVTVGLSSGTSGNRGLFLADAEDQSRWAGTILAKCLPGSILGTHRIALFLRASSNLYEQVGSRKIRFSFFDLLEPIDSLLAKLEAFGPTLLVAPPSMLRMIAQALASGGLSATTREGIRKVISIAEVLDPLDERRISEAFAKPVHQIYQCTEGFLAATCSKGSLHLNEDLVHVEKEWLDQDAGKFVPILTDFVRRTQPIVRYRLNDILTEDRRPCPCGSPFTRLSQIEGRCDDLFYLNRADGQGTRAVFPDFIRRAVLEASEGIEHYVVGQAALDRLEIELTLGHPALAEQIEASVRQSIARICSDLGCEAPKVEFIEPRPREAGRKLKRIERRFKLEGEVVG